MSFQEFSTKNRKMTGTVQRSTYADLWPPAVLICLGLMLYGQVLWNGYLPIDDPRHVFENSIMLESSPVKAMAEIWRKPYFGMYIPVTYTAWWTIARLTLFFSAADHLTALPFHAANLLLHITNACLVYLFCRRLTFHPSAALVGACIFLVHPTQVESVAWIGEFRGLLSTFFILLTLWFYLGAPPAGRRRYEAMAASVLTTLLALLSKPSAAAIPLLLLVIQVAVVDRGKIHWRHLFTPAGFFLVILPVVWITRNSQSVNTYVFVTPFLCRPLIFGDSLLFYTWSVLVPLHLSIHYAHAPVQVLLSNTNCLSAGLALSVAGGLAVWGWHRHGLRSLLGAGLAIAALAPVSGFISFTFQSYSTVADRYLYLPMVGVGIALAGVYRHADRYGRGLVLGFLLFLTVLSVPTLAHWRSSASLFAYGQRNYPASTLCLQGLAELARQEGDLGRARKLIMQAVAASPFLPHSYLMLGEIYRETGKPLKAARAFGAYLDILPNSPPVMNAHALALLDSGDRQGAVDAFRKSLERRPDDPDLHFNLAAVLLEKGDVAAALDEYRQCLEIRPNDVSALVNAGKAAAVSGNADLAMTFYRRALLLNPRQPTALYNLGNACMHNGDIAAAVAAYDEAVRQEPTVESLHNLGLALLELGNCKRAEEAFVRIAEIAPEQRPLALERLAMVYDAMGKQEKAAEFRKKAADNRASSTVDH